MRYTNYMDDNDMDVTNSRVTFVSRGCHVGFTSWAYFSAKTDARAHIHTCITIICTVVRYMFIRCIRTIIQLYAAMWSCPWAQPSHAHVYIMRRGAPMRT